MFINSGDENKSEDWVDIRSLGVYLHTKTIPETPSINLIESDNISGRKILLDSTYTHRDIEVELVAKGRDSSELRELLVILTSMFSGRFSVIFKDNESQMYTDVHLSSEISVEAVTSSVYILSVNMTAYNPFRKSTEITIDTFEIKSETNIRVEVEGNHSVKPIVELTGSATTISVSVDGKTLTYDKLISGDKVTIDNDRYTVEREFSGQKENGLYNWSNNFIELKPGDNNIYVTGEDMNVEMKIIFRDSFL